MPGTRCTVAVCNNSFEKTKRAGMNIMYHQFPKIQPMRNIWIERCRRAGTWNPNSCHICSIHFTDDDYNLKDRSFKYINVPVKGRLKSTAVPTLFLTTPPPLELTSFTQKKRKKTSVNDETSMYSKNEDTIYLRLNDVNNLNGSISDLPIYEELKEENLRDENFTLLSEYENYDIQSNVPEELDSFYMDKKEKRRAKNQVKSLSMASKFKCITVKDHSTQTDTDHFLENYKQLIDKNESLESELVKWECSYKTLMTNMKYLESKIQRLTLSSSRAE